MRVEATAYFPTFASHVFYEARRVAPVVVPATLPVRAFESLLPRAAAELVKPPKPKGKTRGPMPPPPYETQRC